MKNIINTENFEQYYLDYLEGNLNDKDLNEFEEFLFKNPELNIGNDNSLIYLEDENHFNFQNKNSLKIFDENEKINDSNVEQFMIASIEKIINEEKINELNNFTKSSPILLKELAFFKKTILKDENIKYVKKNKLKKGIIIPMYYKQLAFVASLVLIFLFIKYSNDNLKNLNKFSTKISSNNVLLKTQEKIKNTKKVNTLNQTKISKTILNKNNKIILKTKYDDKVKLDDLDSKINTLQFLSASINVELNKEIDNLNQKYENQILESNTSLSLSSSYVSVNEMDAPLKIITNEINDRLNQNLDFRIAKATTKKQGGFYFKFKTLEIIHKKKPISNDLISQK